MADVLTEALRAPGHSGLSCCEHSGEALNMRVGFPAAVAAALAAFAVAAHAQGDSQWIPTGQRISPTAAAGSTFRELDPGLKDFPDFRAGQAVTTAASHDGKTLLVLTSGFNQLSDASGKGHAHS